MRKGPINTIAAVTALLVAGMVVLNASNAGDVIESKNLAQTSVNQRLSQHLVAYEALQSEVQGWDSEFQSIQSAKDLLGIFQVLDLDRFGLYSNLDDLRLTDATPYIQNDHPIGLVSICMDSGAGELNVYAEDYQQLLEGLHAMAESQDVTFETVTIRGQEQQAMAKLSGLCMLLRDEAIS